MPLLVLCYHALSAVRLDARKKWEVIIARALSVLAVLVLPSWSTSGYSCRWDGLAEGMKLVKQVDKKNTTILEQYKTRQAAFEAQRNHYEKQGRRISAARLIAFLAAAVGIVGGLGHFFAAWQLVAGLGVAFLLVFVALVLWHDKVLQNRRRSELLGDINAAAMYRMERDWAALDHHPVPLHASSHSVTSHPVASHPVAIDLDLFSSTPGAASLFHMLSTGQTEVGKTRIQDWLLHPASPDEITMRHGAVEELARALAWRQELELYGRLLPSAPPDMEKFIAWAQTPPWLSRHKVLLIIARLLGGLPIVLLGLHLAGWIPQYWILAALFNLAFFAFFTKRCHIYFEQVSAREHAFKQFAHLFEHLSATTFESDYLKTLERRLTADRLSAFEQMRRLDRLVGMADVRLSPMLYIPLQAMSLWSIHVWQGLEGWQRRAGVHVRGWFEALGEFEALAALADLKHNHPDWVFPKIVDGVSTIRAMALGHPMLHPDSCVTNDVAMGPTDTFQMITGSNMSGKSTLLRAVGLNVVLAQAGGPVFAKNLTMPPVMLATSFRIQDSLQAGVSFFMAELRRLKEIVDMADAHRAGESRMLLYLLDEILQGTNVSERQIAVRRVVGHLVEKGAIGAISTHDLSLATAEGLADHCEPHHFVESYTNDAAGASMHFDYTLRPGVAPTVNALKLLELVGLKEEKD